MSKPTATLQQRIDRFVHKVYETPKSFSMVDLLLNDMADRVNRHIAVADLMTDDEQYQEWLSPKPTIEHERKPCENCLSPRDCARTTPSCYR